MNNRMSLEGFNERSYRARRAFKRSLLSEDQEEEEQEKGEDLLEDSGKLLWERRGSLDQDYGSEDVNKCLDSKNIQKGFCLDLNTIRCTSVDEGNVQGDGGKRYK